MKRILKHINRAEEYVLVISLVVTVVLIFSQVIMRYIFKSSLSWSEEIARYIFVWQIWLGASLGVKHRKHIRVEIIYRFFSKKGRKYHEIFVLLLWLGMALFLTFNGSYLVQQLISRHSLSPAVRLPMGYMYASVPVGCGLMSIRLLQELYKEVTFLRMGGE